MWNFWLRATQTHYSSNFAFIHTYIFNDTTNSIHYYYLIRIHHMFLWLMNSWMFWCYCLFLVWMILLILFLGFDMISDVRWLSFFASFLLIFETEIEYLKALFLTNNNVYKRLHARWLWFLIFFFSNQWSQFEKKLLRMLTFIYYNIIH